MNADSTPDSATPAPAVQEPAMVPGKPVHARAEVRSDAAAVAQREPLSAASIAIGLLALVAVAAMVATGLLWQKVTGMQEQLARQSAEAGVQAVEARTLARQAVEQARETGSRQAVIESRLAEVTVQRAQLDELMQSLSRSRDENLVVDIESAVRLALQQAQLTGSVEPLLAALKSADLRISRAGQPRLALVQRAIARDIERIKSAAVTDTPGMLVRIDELVRMVDELPVVNAPPQTTALQRAAGPDSAAPGVWWERLTSVLGHEARKLVRVSRIEQPEAVLLSPEQNFFLRENLKFKLLNARLGLLARQMASARADLASAAMALNKYFDPGSRKTQVAATVLQQVQGQLKSVELPNVDDTLAALTTAAAGR